MDVQEIADPCAFDTLLTKNVPQILERIFLSLDYESFKECLKVNKGLNGLLKSESFQVKAKLMFHKEVEDDARELCIMWHAAKYGSIRKVQRLLSSGMVDVNHMTDNMDDHTTPFY